MAAVIWMVSSEKLVHFNRKKWVNLAFKIDKHRIIRKRFDFFVLIYENRDKIMIRK